MNFKWKLTSHGECDKYVLIAEKQITSFEFYFTKIGNYYYFIENMNKWNTTEWKYEDIDLIKYDLIEKFNKNYSCCVL